MTNWHARIDGLLNPARDLEALAHEMAVRCEELEQENTRLLAKFALAAENEAGMDEMLSNLQEFVAAYDNWAFSDELCGGPLFDAMVMARQELEGAPGGAVRV